ncbi:MAG: PD-(D/E)XK nuclease family protein [Chthonomonadaceae bacterium]|nr:PD-(D/E)XK nuclease family protein [Chthonomonadaceae bacterium]
MPRTATPKIEKPKTPRKPVLSPTKINTYLDCVVKYRYVYVDKIGKFYQKSRSYYSFGTSLHHVLQEFHEGGATHTAEELTTTLDQSWVSAGYETPAQEAEHQEKGREIVAAYHAAHQERAAEKIETVATEKTLNFDMNGFRLTGRVDRIDQHPNGTLEIIDYKSGRWEVTPEEVVASLAMNIYQLILQRNHPDVPVVSTIYSLRSGISATAALTPDALTEFEAEIQALGTEILNRDYHEARPEPKEICETCEFLSLCKRYWRQQEDYSGA